MKSSKPDYYYRYYLRNLDKNMIQYAGKKYKYGKTLLKRMARDIVFVPEFKGSAYFLIDKDVVLATIKRNYIEFVIYLNRKKDAVALYYTLIDDELNEELKEFRKSKFVFNK